MKKFFLIAGTVTTLVTGMTYNLANADDGAKAALVGTIIHNEIHPDKPLPVLHGDDQIIRDTLSGIGAGKSATKAFGDAAEKETKVPEAKPAKDPAPPQQTEHHQEIHEHDHIDRDRDIIHEHFQDHVTRGGDERDFQRA